MRNPTLRVFRTILPLLILTAGLRAADDKPGTAASSEFSLSVNAGKPAPSSFSPAQVALVVTWIRSKVPECPTDAAPISAEKFLDELQLRHPEALDRLLTADFPEGEYESMLLQFAATQLQGPHQSNERDAVALRRVGALLKAQGGGAGASAAAAGMIAKIKDLSSFTYRRLAEGRLDDDDVVALFKQVQEAGTDRKAAATAPDKPQDLSAGEIVSEFARRNQVGSALANLRAYEVEGRLTNSKGEVQDLLLFKLRPDLFRLLLRVGGVSRYVLAYDGQHFWQQVPGKPPQTMTPEEAGSRRDLRAFVDLMFQPDEANFERLPDGLIGGRKCYRLSVQVPGSPAYVACVDRENFHELARENAEKSRTSYSDFRDVAGVTLAFHEEAVGPDGRRGDLVIKSITPNPGLIRAFFAPPSAHELDFFAVEQLLTKGSAMAANPPAKAD